MKARSGVEHQFSAGIAEIRNAAESGNGFMAQVMKQFQAPVVMGAIFNESNGLPPDYESGGRRFESFRARHFLICDGVVGVRTFTKRVRPRLTPIGHMFV